MGHRCVDVCTCKAAMYPTKVGGTYLPVLIHYQCWYLTFKKAKRLLYNLAERSKNLSLVLIPWSKKIILIWKKKSSHSYKKINLCNKFLPEVESSDFQDTKAFLSFCLVALITGNELYTAYWDAISYQVQFYVSPAVNLKVMLVHILWCGLENCSGLYHYFIEKTSFYLRSFCLMTSFLVGQLTLRYKST